jgi:hypothetical protein
VNLRALLLPLAALLAAGGLIAVHLAAGGDEFVPARAPDPCVERPLAPPTTELEPLAEAVVLDGVQRAACALGVPRERLVLALPSARDRRRLAREAGRSEAGLAVVLRGGLGRAVRRMDRAGRLPRASALLDTYAGDLGLPGLAEQAVRRFPDRVVDDLVPTGPVVERALARVDVLAVLRDLDDPDALEGALTDAVRDAALVEARTRLLAKIPGPLRGLLPFG